jgi:hypothetical protein
MFSGRLRGSNLSSPNNTMTELTLSFSFANIRADNSCLVEDWELLLRVVSDFEITVGSSVIYREEEFCAVEFAVQALEWSRQLGHGDFEYRTMEAEETGFVFIKSTGTGWQVGSIHQTCEAQPLPIGEIQVAIEDCWIRLRDAVKAHFDRDISALLSLPARTVGFF